MHKNPIADVLTAFVKLSPDASDDASRRKIARLLGVDWKDAVTQIGETGEQPASGMEDLVSGESTPVVTAPPKEATTTHDISPTAEPRPVSFRVHSSAPAARQAPDWLGRVELFPKQTSVPVSSSAVEPLFRPDWASGILSSALSSLRPDGPVDIAGIVNRICRGEAITTLPRVRWATLSRGVQLIVDRAEGMTPFSADEKWFEQRLSRILGSHALEVLHFAASPLRKAGRGSRRSWKPYRELPPPRVGTTVVALTDLGIPDVRLRERQASPDEWIEFAKYLRSLGCPLVAFVPYPDTRWPQEVRNHMTVLPWDRRTSASSIRNLVGRGLQ